MRDYATALTLMNSRSIKLWRMLFMITQLALCASVSARSRLDLTGTWDFYPDVAEASLSTVTVPPGKITVPGAWQTQGYGQPGGSIPSSVVGSDITPSAYLRHNLTARCLYVREVDVPAAWRDQRVFLCVRRVYRYADVTVNDTHIGDYEGFSSPFEFDVTAALRFGQTNRLVIGVDNRARKDRDTVGMANYFGNWGGFGGAVYLEARPVDSIADVFAMPRIAASQVQLRVALKAAGAMWPKGMTLTAEVTPWDASGKPTPPAGENQRPLLVADAKEQTLDLPVPLAPLRLWSPDDPFLYVATVRLWQNERLVDERQVRFGMREIVADGRKLLLNGKPLFLAGYGDDATDPVSGMLPWDKNIYLARLRVMRGLGFNFVRHHSCIPHDEYLDAADEVGLLVQAEAGMAYVKFWPKAHGLFTKEWPNIVTAFRNHPSIWAWCTGNELFLNQLPERQAPDSQALAQSQPATDGVLQTPFSRQDALKIVEQAYHQAKALDPTRLIHTSDGGVPQQWTDIVSAGGWEKFEPKPYLQHEYGNYTCTLPDFALIPRLNGVIRPLTYERALDYVKSHNLEAVYPRLYQSSLAMRGDAQKQCLEAARTTDFNAGYSFWLGIDFPDSPEGCWDEGILNQLWEPKPGLTKDLTDVTGPTVLLTSVDLASRSFYDDQTKVVGLSLSHFGQQPLVNARLSWRLCDGQKLLQNGELPAISCDLGQIKPLGDIRLTAPASDVPQFLTLECELLQGTGRVTKNAWEFYAYPRAARARSTPSAGVYSEAGPIPGAAELKLDQPLPADLRLLITRELKRDRHAPLLRAGKAAVLLLGTGGFKPIKKQSDYFLNAGGGAFGGIIEDHPVFAPIPHQGRLHLGLYQLIAGGALVDAESMPAAFRDGSVVWGLGLTAWISTEKNLQRSALFCDVLSDRDLHLVLCSLDILSDKPESRYVLARTIDYLLAGQPSRIAARCPAADLETLLR